MAGRRDYSSEEVAAAVQRLTEPGRLDDAQRLVRSRAPQLQQILNQALDESDWFGPAHQDEVRLIKITNQTEGSTGYKTIELFY